MARIIPRQAGPVAPIPTVAGSSQTFGLDYRAFTNGVTGSDIRLNWLGANKPSDTQRTVLCKSFWGQQTGYYAWGWLRTYDQSTFEFTGIYELGFHPYPSPVTPNIDANGQVVYDFTPSAQTNHNFEIAGLGGHDYLATAGSTTPKQLVTGTWMSSVMRISLINAGATIRQEYIPDIVGDPTYKIVQDIAVGTLDNGTSGNPKVMVLGASPWTSSNYAGTGSGYTASETPCSIQRQIQIFSGASGVLSDADCISELAAESTAGAVTTAGQASIWYKRRNPKPTDITDESGAGHTPVWANANRPDLYSSP